MSHASHKKISILAIFILLTMVGGILLLQKNETEKTQQIPAFSEKHAHQSQIESDTLKRLETYSGSETTWGISPFGKGKPITEDLSPAGIFHMPNTNWKTRTLSGIIYEFGKGNPKEVALNQEQIKAYFLCKEPFLDSLYKNHEGQCSEDRGYITPEVEDYILLGLSDPNWNKLATECEKSFRIIETDDTRINGENDENFPYFDRVFGSGFLDIDRFISIDPTTKLKILNIGLIRSLSLYISSASHYGVRKGDGYINPTGDCVDRYGTEIVRNLSLAVDIYKNSPEYNQ